MKLTNILLVLISVKTVLCMKLKKDLDREEMQLKVWKDVGAYIVEMILNDDRAEKSPAELVIFDYFELKPQQPATQIMKIAEKIVIENISKNFKTFHKKKDFAMIVLPQNLDGDEENSFERYANKRIIQDFPDRSLKFFIVIDGKSNATATDGNTYCLKVQNRMKNEGYLNILCILSYENTFETYTTVRNDEEYVLSTLSRSIHKFPEYDEINDKRLRVWQQNLAPYSYIKDGKLFGIEGNFAKELWRKYGLTYEIVNNNSIFPESDVIAKKFKELKVDVSFNTAFGEISRDYDNIHFGELDGECFLVPKNIPVSSNHEYFSYPFDMTTSILLIISTIMTTLLWKVLSIYQNTDLPMRYIIFEIYKCLLGKSS